MKKLLFYACLSCLCLACQRDADVPQEDVLGYTYYPLEINQFVEYQIDRTEYFPNDPTKQESFQIREVILDTYTTTEGARAYRIQRYKRTDANVPWAQDSVYSAQRTEFQAIRNANNHAFVKLAFPLAAGKKWNGNSYNEYKADDCAVDDIDVPRKVGNFPFEKTLKVTLANDSNLVFQDQRTEIYARDIGLVRAETKILNYCTDNATCIAQRKVRSGTIKTQTLLQYGKIF